MLQDGAEDLQDAQGSLQIGSRESKDIIFKGEHICTRTVNTLRKYVRR